MNLPTFKISGIQELKKEDEAKIDEKKEEPAVV